MKPPAGPVWYPGRLWSLWDMLYPHASVCFLLGLSIQQVIGSSILMPLVTREPGPRLGLLGRKLFKGLAEIQGQHADLRRQHIDTTRQRLKDALELVKHLTSQVSFVSVQAQAERLERMLSDEKLDAEKLGLAAQELVNRVNDEINNHWFLYLKPDQAKLYLAEALFGADVEKKYNGAKYHIAEAGKCLALDRSTATVFHLMGALERAIHAVRLSLGIPDPDHPQQKTWGSILPAIKTEIDRRDMAKAWLDESDSLFFRGLHASLHAIKGAYRDPTMHVESTYTESEARHIFNVTEGFMRNLASRVDENGEPKQP